MLEKAPVPGDRLNNLPGLVDALGSVRSAAARHEVQDGRHGAWKRKTYATGNMDRRCLTSTVYGRPLKKSWFKPPVGRCSVGQIPRPDRSAPAMPCPGRIP